MYLLLSGKLFVKTEEVDLGKIDPIGLVGEMGVVTGQPRSATIVASEDSRLFGIRRIQLDALLKKDPYLGMRVYKNLSHMLCDKLVVNNIRMEDYAHLLDDYVQPPDETCDEV